MKKNIYRILLDQQRPKLYPKTQFIDCVIRESGEKFNVDIRAVLRLVAKDEALERYLFSNIGEIKWLNPLITAEYFSL